jgi:signal transduction histidine kinase
MKHVVPSVRVWVGIAALAIAAAFLLSYRSIRQNQGSIAAVEHTRQTLSTLIAVEEAMADVIFASGDDAITRATTAARRRVDDLSALTVDNPRQQQRLVRLRDEIDAVATRRRRGTMAGFDMRAETLVPESVSRTVRELRREELQLLTARVEASDLMSRRLTSILIAVGVGSAVLLVLVFGLVVREERHRRQAEQILRRTNEDLDARVSARTVELHDALDREQSLRREAEANSRLKDEFLMTVSHELRTPLNALLGWSDMLRLGILSEARRERAVDAICRNAKLQTQLIADLLDTSRILTGKLRIDPAFVDLSQIVRDAAHVVAPAAAAKGLELKIEVDRHGCVFLGDAVRLQQIVGNLISNAVKFTEHGTVSVRLSRSDSENQMHLVVADTAAEARSALARSACDVLLVDLAMPAEDGYSFIRRMRADGLRQPVAALTAHAHETDRVRALEAGFDVHIQKPVAPHALAVAVAELVSSRAYAN